jgi:glycyl-tRNA synthetase alpha subunit
VLQTNLRSNLFMADATSILYKKIFEEQELDEDSVTISELLESLDIVIEEKSSVSIKYLRIMYRRSCHNSKFDFNIGDIVIIKKYFDINAKNRRKIRIIRLLRICCIQNIINKTIKCEE